VEIQGTPNATNSAMYSLQPLPMKREIPGSLLDPLGWSLMSAKSDVLYDVKIIIKV
jgi:hypothetical protein